MKGTKMKIKYYLSLWLIPLYFIVVLLDETVKGIIEAYLNAIYETKYAIKANKRYHNIK